MAVSRLKIIISHNSTIEGNYIKIISEYIVQDYSLINSIYL